MMKKIKVERFLFGFFFVFVSGCISFKDTHQRFIDEISYKVSLKRPIAKMDYNPDYPTGSYMADFHDLTNKEVRSDGFLIYHYAKGMLTGEYICHYHLVIDPKTDIVVGWGFDTEFSDPQKNCRIAG